MTIHYICPFCGTSLPEKHSPCCGEVGHARAIRTSFVFPPIPDRHSDWQAVFDDEDGEGAAGHGPTEEAAISDLMELT